MPFQFSLNFDTISLMIKLYNTLSRTIEEFKPIQSGKVAMYSCGPTVYRDIHIGNFRTYLTVDTLRRVLKVNDYDTTSIMNITDVGHFRYSDEASKVIDPVVEEAKSLEITPLELSKRYTEKFLHDANLLNILPHDQFPKASEHIKEMIEVIEVLIDKGHAYVSDGNVYFNVESFKEYGKLSGNTLDKMDKLLEAVRVSSEADKEKTADFALWKRADDRVLKWDSPWGEGVPGWHIECSVMSMKYLGVSFDIHCGGEDLIFPHHEDEIAQSEAFSGSQFSRFWVHTNYLLVDDEKMSRSKRNVYTLSDLSKRKISPLAYRYLTFMTHYRSRMNFTWKGVESSQNALDKLYEIALQLPSPGDKASDKYEMKFMDAVNTDLDMPKALSIVWSMLRSDEPRDRVAKTLSKMDDILGLQIFEQSKMLANIPDSIKALFEERESYRKSKKYHLSDQMREKIEKKRIYY